MADPLSSVLDDVLRLDKILSTDGGVLIIDQICLVIPDPRRFPDAEGRNNCQCGPIEEQLVSVLHTWASTCMRGNSVLKLQSLNMWENFYRTS